jgi:hypothetical protein
MKVGLYASFILADVSRGVTSVALPAACKRHTMFRVCFSDQWRFAMANARIKLR